MAEPISIASYAQPKILAHNQHNNYLGILESNVFESLLNIICVL